MCLCIVLLAEECEQIFSCPNLNKTFSCYLKISDIFLEIPWNIVRECSYDFGVLITAAITMIFYQHVNRNIFGKTLAVLHISKLG